MYDWGLLNGAALRALGLTRETPNPPGGDFERDAAGEPTGLARGPAALGWITARIPPATYEQQIASTGALARERPGWG